MTATGDAGDQILEPIVRAHARFARRDAAGAFAGLLEELLARTASECGFLGEIAEESGGEPRLRTYAVSGSGSAIARHRLAVEAIRTGAPVAASDSTLVDPLGELGLQSLLAIPLHANGRLVGMLGLANRPGGYDLATVRVLEPLLATCANLIEAQRDAERNSRAERALQRRNEVDALVLDLSNRLLEACGEKIDAVITECLGRLAVFLGANAASLHHRSRDLQSIVRTHTWGSPELPRLPRDNVLLRSRLDRATLPLAFEDWQPGIRLLRSLDDVPAVAAPERAAMAALGIQATLSIASKTADTWARISLAWIGKPADLDEDELERFVIAADLFGAALHRQREDASVRRHVETEAMLLDLSGRFFELAPERVDEEMHRALGNIARFVGAGRASFSFAVEGGSTIEQTHEWGAAITTDPEAPAQFQRRYGSAALPWVVRTVSSGQAVLVRELSKPPTGAEELLATASYGVRSEAWIPARAGGRVVGAIALCWFERPARITQADLVPFSLAADLFAAVLRRRRADMALRRRAEIDALVLEISNRFLDLPVERVDAEIEAVLCRLAEFANADRVVLDVLSPDRTRLIRTHAVGASIPPRLESTGESSEWVPRDALRIAMDTARTGAIAGMTSIDEVSRDGEARAVMAELGVHDIAWLVARVGEEPVGAILLMWMHTQMDIDRSDLAALAVVSDLLNAAMHRKEAETALRESEERFRVMADSAPLIVWTSDADGRCTFVNEAGRRLAGFPRPGEPPDVWLERIHPDDLASADAAITAAVRDRRGFELEFRVPDETAQWRTLLVAGEPRLGGDGEPLGSVGTAYDITDRKRLEEDLRHAQKMEAVGRLAGGIAHDFNNILTAVIGHVESAQLSVHADEALSRELEGIDAAARRAASLTNQLLAFSRRQIIEPRVIDVNELVGGVEKLLRRLLGEHILLDVILAPGAGCVRADPGQLEQMLINIAANARDAMPEGGWLGIHTERVDAAMAPAVASAVAPPAWVRIEICDTGSGMDETTMSRAFEPFFTTKEVGRGTGLGLATCYGIVQQSHGHISIESHPGSGTCFEILLPAVESHTEAPARLVVPAGAVGGTETVLFVEDELAVRSLAARALERAGYRVLAAAGGEQARALAESAEHPVDILVTDLVMPREGGSAVAAWARERWPGIRVLFISGYSAASPPGVASAEPGIALLAKPFAPQDLLRRVRELLDG